MKKNKSLKLKKEMETIADCIFRYNPKKDTRDPLFQITSHSSVRKEGKGRTK